MAGDGQRAGEIPEKLYFRIGEVSRLTATKPFVLRYWETEFPTLRPGKTPKGHRLYRRQDIETVLEIKRLLYEEGFTIAGARRHLRQPAAAGNGGASAGRGAEPASTGSARRSQLAAARRVLQELRNELRAILTLLEPR